MKKTFFTAVLSFVLAFALGAQTVAVFDFDCDDPDFKEDVSVMTDLLVHELVKAGDVTVVERKKTDKIMAEYAFQANPYVDIASAKKLGKGVGADCIIVGSIATLGCPLYVTARMIDVEKGTIIHSAKMTINHVQYLRCRTWLRVLNRTNSTIENIAFQGNQFGN